MENQKHSGLGITAFIGSLVASILGFLTVIVSGVIELSTPGGMSENSIEAVLIGLFLVITLFLGFVSLGLGIGAAFLKERKKIFAILAIVFSSTTILALLILILIGILMG
jgi:hypothetical protein